MDLSYYLVLYTLEEKGLHDFTVKIVKNLNQILALFSSLVNFNLATAIIIIVIIIIIIVAINAIITTTIIVIIIIWVITIINFGLVIKYYYIFIYLNYY